MRLKSYTEDDEANLLETHPEGNKAETNMEAQSRNYIRSGIRWNKMRNLVRWVGITWPMVRNKNLRFRTHSRDLGAIPPAK